MHTEFKEILDQDTYDKLDKVNKGLHEWYEDNYKNNPYKNEETHNALTDLLGSLSWAVFDLKDFRDNQDTLIEEHDNCYRCLLGLLATIKHEITNLGNRFKREQLDVKESFAATLLLITLIEKVYELNKD